MLRKIIVILACHFEPAIYQTCLILLGEKKKKKEEEDYRYLKYSSKKNLSFR